MKKNIKNLTLTILVFGVLVCTGVVSLARSNSTAQSVNTNIMANKITTNTKADINFQTKANEGQKISEINTTWGEFIDSYIKETKEYYNPRQDISKDLKVRVVKTEYVNGIEAKAGFYGYGLITQIFDEKTGELLNSIGEYKDKK